LPLSRIFKKVIYRTNLIVMCQKHFFVCQHLHSRETIFQVLFAFLAFLGATMLSFLYKTGVPNCHERIQRPHQRYNLTSVDAVIAGTVCPVINVSATDTLIADWDSPPPPDTAGAFIVRAPVEDRVESVEITGIVVRVQDDGAVALKFQSPDKEWPMLLVFLDKHEQQRAEGDIT